MGAIHWQREQLLPSFREFAVPVKKSQVPACRGEGYSTVRMQVRHEPSTSMPRRWQEDY